MMWIKPFDYTPSDHESEKASNSYLMSLIAVLAGLPLPIVNLIATFIFYFNNRKGTYFVRWHCTQALIAQAALLVANSFGFWWTIGIIFGNDSLTNNYVAYMFTIICFNVAELIGTIFSAIQTRKGRHIVWWFYGPITNLICKP